MSRLQELIARLCPDGVPYCPLGEVCDFKRGQTITEKDSIPGDIPVIAGGQKPAYYHNASNREGQTVAIAGSGAYAGYVSWWENPVFISDAFTVSSKTNKLMPKYIYYVLKNMQEKIHNTKKGSGVPHVHGSSIAKFEIPVPPIEVQEEIVRILDRFADYAAELQAELQARKEQYEYYRNLLLTFNPSTPIADKSITTWGGHSYEITWKTMGEICMIINAPKKLNRKDYLESAAYPIIDQGMDYVVGYSNCVEALLPDDEYVLFGEHTKNIKYFKGRFIQGADGLKILKPKDSVMPKFLYHVMKTLKIEDRGYNRHWTVVSPLPIPIPPLELQEKIVAVLDRFETLVNDLTEGLPAEIAAVREQYEYYRNQLLSFPKVS